MPVQFGRLGLVVVWRKWDGVTRGSIIDNGMGSGRRRRFGRRGFSGRVLDQFNEKGLRVGAWKPLSYDGLGGGRQHVLGVDIGVHVWGV